MTTSSTEATGCMHGEDLMQRVGIDLHADLADGIAFFDVGLRLLHLIKCITMRFVVPRVW